MKNAVMPVRQFRCRLEELGPLNDMVKAMFTANQPDFSRASPEYGAAGYLTGWDARTAELDVLVPTAARRASDKEVTKTMNGMAKSLRDPLNWLNIRLNRAGKKLGLTAAVEDFGLGKVRTEISTRDAEGLDGALHHLLTLLQVPANATALAAQGHTPADTQAFGDARQQIAELNLAQNENMNSKMELTAENVAVGNVVWEYIQDVLETGHLMYKETQPKKAKTFQLAALMKRVRNEGGGPVPPKE